MRTACPDDGGRYIRHPSDHPRRAETDRFRAALNEAQIVIGWPTLFEAHMVLTGKGFANAAVIVSGFVAAPNVNAMAIDGRHYQAAEKAFDRSTRDAIREPEHGRLFFPMPLR